MSHLPLQSTTQLSSFTHSLSAGTASSCSNSMDNAILSLSHSAELAGSGSFPIEDGTQHKVTLLTRPQQPPSVSGIHSTSLQHSLQNDVCGNSVAFMTSAGPVQGRAARDDYYDTEDPSVNLHEFIINSMQAPKNRVILLKLEEEFYSYVADSTRVKPYKLPPWDSYHRMLAHRVAAYFGLEHNVDPLDKTCVVVCKGPNTRIPKRRFSDYMKTEDGQASEPKLILKRSPKEVSKLEQLDAAVSSSVNAPEVKGLKSFEEREEEYEKARARIFNQQPTMQNSRTTMAFDLATGSTPRTSSLFTSMMHHRRAASDTTMFKRSVTTELKKEGASSSHSSRSSTPLISLLSRPTGCSDMGSQSLSTQLSPQKSPPVQNPPTASSLQEQPYPMNPHTLKQKQQDTNYALNPPVQFQPVQAPLPVMYPQQAAVVDPTWYYQQMMLYQMSPQSCIPRPQYAGVQQLVHPGAMFSRYTVAPGVVGQHGLISPSTASGGSPQISPARLPLGVDLPSPPHASTGVLVRPVPQQPSSLRFAGKLENPWGSPQFAPAIVAQQFPMGQQPSPTAFTTLVPVTAHGSILAEQMKSLNLSDSASGYVCEKTPPSSTQPSPVYGGGGATTGDHVDDQSSTTSPDYPGNKTALNGTEQGIAGGQFSPHSAVHFISSQQPLYRSGREGSYLGGVSMIPGATGGLIQYPSNIPHAQTPAQTPSTPPIGAFTIPSPMVVHAQQQQGIFSPASTGIQSPVQILGHTLGTSLFSPPPSTASHHGIFVNSPSTTGKISFSPVFPAVGSGSAQQTPVPESSVAQKQLLGKDGTGDGNHQLPPRLVQHRFSGNRYQNQRQSSNKIANKPTLTQSAELVSSTCSSSQTHSSVSNSSKREPLLPTPPSNQMVKLDTSLTCGVPINVMEVISFPLEGTPDNCKAIEALYEMGAKGFKTGKMMKSGEKIMIVIFDTPESALIALQSKHPLFSLSIPRNNHSKFIMTLL